MKKKAMKMKYKKYLISGGAILAGFLVRQLVEEGWSRVTGHEPPENPAARSVSMAEAIAWTAAISVAGGMANVVFRKLVGEATENKTR